MTALDKHNEHLEKLPSQLHGTVLAASSLDQDFDSLSSAPSVKGKELQDEFRPVHGNTRTPHFVHKWHHQNAIMSLACSDKYIFAGSKDGLIYVYSVDSYQQIAVLRGHQSTVFCLVLTRDFTYLFSGSSDSLVKVWNVETLIEEYTIYSTYDIGDIFSATWSPTNQCIYFGAQNCSIQWLSFVKKSGGNASTGTVTKLPSYRFDKFFDSRGPGGRLHPAQYVGQKPSHNKESVLLEVPRQNIIQYAHNGYVYALSACQIGDLGELLISAGGDGCLKIWNLATHTVSKQLCVNSPISSLTASTTDPYVYCALQDGNVALVDADTMQIMRVDKCCQEDINCLAIHQECLFKGTASEIHEWTTRRYHRGSWKAHDGGCLAMATTPEGRRDENHKSFLVTAGSDCCVIAWDLSDVSNGSTSTDSISFSCSEPSISALDNTNLIRALKKCVSYVSVSDGKHVEDSHRCASYLKSLSRHFGAESKLIPVEDSNPIVYAEFKAPENKRKSDSARILFYGHYDVISVSESWNTDPFCLTAMDGYLYGRGVSDNKGPTIAALFAAADLVQSGKLENDIIFVIEGEEECGSAGFVSAMEKVGRGLIGPIDWILLSNSYWLDDETPCLNYGLRGTIKAEVKISSGREDLHSGVHGGVFREPTIDLVNLMAKLTSDSGEVLIPGFQDGVRVLNSEEEALYDAITQNTEFDKNTLLRRWRYPSLTIHRMGVSGPNSSTVIPETAVAVFSIRIVPDQSPNKLREVVLQYLTECFEKFSSTNKLQIEIHSEAEPWVGNPTNSAFQILRQAIEDAWGTEPLFIREGGSIPVVGYLEKFFKAPVAQLPCGQASDGAHLDNERLRFTNLVKTREVLVSTFGALHKR